MTFDAAHNGRSLGAAAVIERAVGSSDGLGQVLQPNVLLPTQLPLAPEACATPERRLLLAVLEDAIGCYLMKPGRRGRRVQRLCREAECWLFAELPYWTVSFEGICDVLGLDAAYVRRGLLQCKAREQQGAMGRSTRRDPGQQSRDARR